MKFKLFILLFLCVHVCTFSQSYISNDALLSNKRYNSASKYSFYSPTTQPTLLSTQTLSGSPATHSFGAGVAPISKRSSQMSSYIYSPFTNETPSARGPRKANGLDNDDDDDWGGNGEGTGGNAGDPEKNPFSPIGSSWCLLLFALTLIVVRTFSKNKAAA